MIAKAVVFLVILFQAAAIFAAWRAIRSARTPQGAVGWVVFLLTAPFVGVSLYLFLGHHRYKGYSVSRRASKQVIEGVKQFAEDNAYLEPPVVDPTPFERIAQLPAVRGNKIVPLINGHSSFEAIFAAIDSAQRYVLVQFFIVHDDELGRAFRDKLIAAAARGVKVLFMADAVGSHKLSPDFYASLRDANVEVVDPGEGDRPKHRFQLNYRNHRKTVVVDGRIGFTGGLNVGDEYMGRDPFFGNWRDTHLEIRGPVVQQLQLVFAEDWHWARSENLLDELEWSAEHAAEDTTALLVPTGPADRLETGALFFFAAIAAARERVWIASPYLVPDTDVLSALKLAAIRGLDVKILVPEVIDHKIPWLAAFAFFDELREVGVEIWRYTNGFMHQKVVLIDDDFAAIGTTNFDNRSFRLNFETMVAVFDGDFATEVHGFLEKDLLDAYKLEKELSEQSRKIRIGAPIARLFAPIL